MIPVFINDLSTGARVTCSKTGIDKAVAGIVAFDNLVMAALGAGGSSAIELSHIPHFGESRRAGSAPRQTTDPEARPGLSRVSPPMAGGEGDRPCVTVRCEQWDHLDRDARSVTDRRHICQCRSSCDPPWRPGRGSVDEGQSAVCLIGFPLIQAGISLFIGVAKVRSRRLRIMRYREA